MHARLLPSDAVGAVGRTHAMRLPGMWVGGLVLGALLHVTPVVAGEAAAVSQPEKDALLAMRMTQAEAVVALSEAMATAQTVSRARQYWRKWQQGPTGAPGRPGPTAAQIQARERNL
jgi:hypothetical protein